MAKSYIIGVIDFSKTVQKLLDEYGDDVYEVVDEVIPDVAKEASKRVKAKSRKFGWNKYASGWKVTTENLRGHVGAVVHNETRYQITHLLEFSHPMPQGGSSEAYSHIAEPNQWAQEEAYKQIEERLKHGL